MGVVLGGASVEAERREDGVKVLERRGSRRDEEATAFIVEREDC